MSPIIYRLDQAKRLNLETLATDTGESFRQSGLKPYVSGASLSNWDVAGDRAAALQLEQTRGRLGAIVGGPNAAIALAPLGFAGASYLSGLNLSARTIMVANGLTAGGAKAYTNVVDKGEVRLPSVLFATGTGMLGGQLGASYGFITNGAIGAGFSMVDTAYNNYFYREDEKYLYNAGLSFAFGGLGKSADLALTNRLQKSYLPITYSNVSNFSFKAPVAGGVAGSVISNLPPVLFRDKKPE